jgi:Ig-like domain-containing protein/FIMAH domain-containing protein
VTGTSGLQPGFDGRDMFGGQFGWVEPGHTIFADGRPPGFVHYIEWQTPTAVTVGSFALFAQGDSPVYNNEREFAQFVLKAKSDPGSTNYDLTLYTYVVTNHPYSFVDPVNYALIATNINPVTAQYFRAEFTQYTAGRGYDGPRILELDGFAPITPYVISQPTNVTVTVGGTATFEVLAGGKQPLFYQWTFNGTNIDGATNASLTLTDVQTNQAGHYSVSITNAFGSTNSASTILNLPPVADATATLPLAISVNNSNATVVLDGSRSYDPDGDSLEYFWHIAGTTNVLATGVVAVVVLPLGTNSITLEVSDGLASDQQTITVEVLTPAQAAGQLLDLVTTDVSKAQSLAATLSAAIASINRGNPTAAINQLQAFQNQISAQVAPLDPALAQTLINAAQNVIDSLGGNSGPGKGKISEITRHANGHVRIGFQAAVGPVYIIEASTDLVNWVKIGVATNAGNVTFEFEDSDAAKMPWRFYRVIVP